MSVKPKVLVFIVGGEGWGGIESFVLNLCKELSNSDVQIDVISSDATGLKRHEEEFNRYHVRVYDLNIRGNMVIRKLKAYSEILRFLRTHDYSAIHINTSNMFAELPVLFAAKKAGMQTRIVHSHNTTMDVDHALKKILRKCTMALNLGRKAIGKAATHYLACSQPAAEWLFSEQLVQAGQVKLVNNGIDANKFRYAPEIRAEYRRQLGLDGKFVIGNIGRFNYQKNHDFLLDVFCEIHNRHPESVLLLVGEGELKAELQAKVTRLQLTDSVCFLGLRADVPQLLQAMDVFVLPSHFEGLPVVAIEVQAAGLRTFLSDAVTEEAAITDLVAYLSLAQSAEVWAETILQCKDNCAHRDMYEEIMAAGYDMKDTAKWMERFYLQQGGENGEYTSN